VGIGYEINIPALAAVAAVGPAKRDKFFSPK